MIVFLTRFKLFVIAILLATISISLRRSTKRSYCSNSGKAESVLTNSIRRIGRQKGI